MSDSREVPYDQLPARVRADLEDAQRRLGPELRFGRVVTFRGGWVATVCTLDGHEGGSYMIPGELGEVPEK